MNSPCHSSRSSQRAKKHQGSALGRQRRRSTRYGQRHGAAAVEFAIVANLLFVIIFTCIEFARLNMVRNLAQDAAYFAARQASVPGGTAEDAIMAANAIMSSMLPDGYEVIVPNLNNASETISVEVRVNLSEVALVTPLFLSDSTIRTVARIRAERYDGFFQQ